MANTRFYLDARRSKDGKPSNLKIAVQHNHQSAHIPLNVRLHSTQWDEKTQRIVKHNDAAVLNAYIGNVKMSVDSTIADLTRARKISTMSAPQIRDYCLDELDPARKEAKAAETTFLYRFNKYAEHTVRGTRKTFEYTLNKLVAYVGENRLKNLRFEDITRDWLLSFDLYLQKSNIAQNTRSIFYRNMRTVFNAAIDEEITTNYPFRRFKIKREKTAKRNLTVEELRLLFFFPCEKHATRYLDFFKLSFYLQGVNSVDICNLKKDDLVKGRLQFHRTKTRHFYSMLVEPEAQQIIEKYKGKDYLIDVLDHWGKDEDFRKKMNRVLQKIGPVTIKGQGAKKHYKPLFPKVTSYYARHTWATIASSIDIPDKVISEGLGHEYGNPITNIYIDFDNRKLDKANRQVLDWVLYGKQNGVEVVKPGTPEFFGLQKSEAEKLGFI